MDSSQPPQIIKMSKLATGLVFRPQLQYLPIKIHNNGNNTILKALIDSGCAQTAMSSKLYKKLKIKDPSLNVRQCNAKIQTCDGTTHGIEGLLKIELTIGDKGIITINLNVMVVPNLADEFLIGSDVLHSNLVVKTTPKAIYFKCPQTKKVVMEPFKITVFPIQPIKLCKMGLVKPLESLIMSQTLAGFKSLENAINIPLTTQNPFKIAKIALDRDELTVRITNQTSINQSLKNLDKVFEIYRMSPLDTLPNDDYLNDDEKYHALDDAKELGYFQPSVTSYIENRNMITEADKVDIPTEAITDEVFLKMFDLSHFTNNDKNVLIDILLRHRTAFAMHKYDIGRTNVLEMDIEILTKEPKIQKYVPIAMNVRERANEILQQMEHYDIIRECHEPSPYVSNILVIPKKDKINVRLLFDGRLLNYDTKRMPMSLISKGEILSKLINKTHLTSLDFADAFYQIPLSKQAQPLTAFWTPNQGKRMCFNRAPQGLRNSPMYLKLVLDKVFYDMDENVIFYADDLLVASSGTIRDHFALLDKVLGKLRNANLKLRPQKLLIARETIEFLGMVFKRQTLNIPEARLEAFKKLPSPNTAKRLKSALCAFSYYRHFVPHFAELTRELMQMTQLPPREFKFLAHHETKFREIIEVISRNAKTHFPDKERPFYVQTDASMYCAGGRLYQKDDEGNEKLIAAVSRTFTKTEQNYTIYKKEALALLYTLRSMDYYIQFAKKLIILVDSKALTYIRLAKESSGILLRFSLELSKYDADIIHVPGEQNEISDLLSRQHKDIARIEADNLSKKTISEKDTIKIVEALTIPEGFTMTKTEFFNLLNGPSPRDDTVKSKTNKSKAKEGLKYIKNTPVTLNNRKIKMPNTTKNVYRPGVLLPTKVVTRSKTKKLKRKPEIREPIKGPLAKTNDTTREYSDIGMQISITTKGILTLSDLEKLQHLDPMIASNLDQKNITKFQSIIYWKTKDGPKVFIPTQALRMLIHTHHYMSPGIHKSTKQISRDILKIYYYPRDALTKIIKSEIQDCHICQIYADKPASDEVSGLPKHTTARVSWSMDLITDLPLSTNGYKLLLICVDDFSNYIIGIPLKAATTNDIIKAIKYHIIQPFGTPKFIRTDEQPGIYNSKDFYQFASEHNIQLQATAVGSPFSNGRAERTIKTFKIAARKYFYQNKNILKWDEENVWITSALNSSVNSYGFSPEEIMFGVKNTESTPLIDLKFINEQEQADPAIKELFKRAELIRRKYFQMKSNKQNVNITFKNKEATKKQFEKGELVLHRQLQVSTGTASKWKPLMTGPFVVEEVQPSQRTAICQDLKNGKKIKAHFTNLQRYALDESTFRLANQASGLVDKPK